MGKIPGGYILQPRKLDDSEISNSPPHVREIWLYFHRKANYADNPRNETKRGQLLTSYTQIINDLSWSVGYRKESYKRHHCETAMKTLTKAAMITTTKTARGLLITICNYDHYQNPENYDNHTDSHNENRNDTETITTLNQKKEKKGRKKEKNNTILMSELENSDNLNEYEKIAFSFWQLIDHNLQKLGISSTDLAKAKYKTWVDPIRLAIQNDSRTKEQFAEIFDFLKAEIPRNGFSWAENIRSTAKLREKFERLLSEARKTKSRNQSSYTQDLINQLKND